MSQAARAALIDALERCRGKARVIILTGSGPAFCAGLDLKEFSARREQAPDDRDRLSDWRTVQETIRQHPAIVIASVNGFALGGGVTLVNAADLAIADETAQFGMPEIGFGLYPELAGPSTQLRLRPKRAAWMVLTAKRIDGRTAAAWGLVNLAVPADQLATETLALARHVAQYDAVTLEVSKRALWDIPMQVPEWGAAMRLGEDLNAEIRSRAAVSATRLRGFAAGGRNPGQGANP
jgi:enoyl-CoA hydratase/carnithine racemase